MWRDLESEGSVIESGNQIDVQNGQEIDPEKDGVRRIFHEWGSKGFGGRTRMNNGSRGQKIDENECNCRGSSEIGSPIARTRDGTVARNSIRRIFGRQALIDLLKRFKREREIEVEGLLENHFVSNFAHRHRIQSLLKGRFLRNQRFVQVEKQSYVAARDLGLLRKTHAVADIRKGFLSKLNKNDHVADGAHSDSDISSANDLHIHTGKAEEVVWEKPHEISEEIETNDINCDPKSVNPQGVSPVGEIHDADASSDNDTKYDLIEENGEIVEEMPPLTVELAETTSQDHDLVETNQSNRNMELLQGTSGSEHPEFDSMTEADKAIQPSVSLPLLPTTTDSFNWQDSVSEYEDDDDGWYQESLEESYDDNVEDTPESWFAGRSNVIYSPYGGNGSRVELRELTSRRRVSNLLKSDFGTRLDLLMQSYVDRQDRVFESENGLMQSLDENAGGIEAVDGTERAHSSTLVIAQTHGNNDLHGATDLRVPVIRQHLGTEPEIISGLRNDLNALRERMNDMQRMLEACMDVQLELQRSVQQEVYSALNRSINSGGACENGISNDHSASSPGKEGACFLCCDNGLESLPNRFAHVYICSKCAEKINWSKLKESVRHS